MDDFGLNLSLSCTKNSVLAHEYQMLSMVILNNIHTSWWYVFFCFGKMIVLIFIDEKNYEKYNYL